MKSKLLENRRNLGILDAQGLEVSPFGKMNTLTTVTNNIRPTK